MLTGGHCPPIHFITDAAGGEKGKNSETRIELLETGGYVDRCV